MVWPGQPATCPISLKHPGRRALVTGASRGIGLAIAQMLAERGAWYIDTPLAKQVLSDGAYLHAVLERTPLQRIGKPEELAGAVVFLCLPVAGYITGQVLAVDGGFSINGF